VKKFNQARVNGGSNYDSTLNRVRIVDVKASASVHANSMQRDTVKLREHPKDLTTKLSSKGAGGRANSPGYGNNVSVCNNGQSAAKSYVTIVIWMQFND
jgi:hypothetical protein